MVLLVERDISSTEHPGEQFVAGCFGKRFLGSAQQARTDAKPLEIWVNDQPADLAPAFCAARSHGTHNPLSVHGLVEEQMIELVGERSGGLGERRKGPVVVQQRLAAVSKLLKGENLFEIRSVGAADDCHFIELNRDVSAGKRLPGVVFGR